MKKVEVALDGEYTTNDKRILSFNGDVLGSSTCRANCSVVMNSFSLCFVSLSGREV